ncbi:patatin-like phospholipase family protein [Rhodohalobacter sp. SW132]|uniref:patatin-like phospholipase family protein n=1 Tax=Rhodohalobacter sp. SW132 TaxID=2293433 RepID=UPI001313E29A|nr:patatin-like phospholipase family protein [Rhodohalobacter sp. SW132]
MCTLFLIANNIDTHAFPNQSAINDSLRIGLVLSGGGAKGIAHIGVIEAIEEAGIRIDYISGTSMGALVGGLYAMGYTTEQLREIVESNNFNELFLDRRRRVYISNYEKLSDERALLSIPISGRGISLPSGVISGQNIYTLLSRLSWNMGHIRDFDDLPVPFTAVATDLETGNDAVLRSGYLPDALRASISIPSIFTPIEIEDRIYVDGGLIRNLPVQDALDMGANYTIAVYVGSKLEDRSRLNSLTSILNQTVSFRINENVERQQDLADYFVEVTGLEDFTAADFGRADTLLKIGRHIGQQHLEAFREIAEMQNTSPAYRPGAGPPEPLLISQIVIEGNTIYEDAVLINLLGFVPGSKLDPDIIEESISQLYSSTFIKNVHYRVEDIGGEFVLHIRVIEDLENKFRLGARYENKTKASILLNASFQNLIHSGSLTQFEARLGEQLNFRVEHTYFSIMGSRSAFLSAFEFENEVVEWYAGNDIVSRHDNTILRGELSWGNYFSTNNLIAFGVRKGFTQQSNQINQDQIRSTDRDYHALFVRYMRDKLNRKSFPVGGRKLKFQSFVSDQVIFSPIDFSSTSFNYQINTSISSGLTFRNSIWLGYSTGSELPWGYWISPNRHDPFLDVLRFGGADRYQLSSRNAQVVSTGIQIEPFYHWFIGLDAFGGRFLNNWDTDLNQNDIDFSFSLSLGTLTLLGPIELILSRSRFYNFHTELHVGFRF